MLRDRILRQVEAEAAGVHTEEPDSPSDAPTVEDYAPDVPEATPGLIPVVLAPGGGPPPAPGGGPPPAPGGGPPPAPGGGPGPAAAPSDPDDDDIRTDYHPHSGRPSRVEPFATFKRGVQSFKLPDIPGPPWAPFMSREDFDFADLVAEAALSESQIDTAVKLILRILETRNFSYRTVGDVRRVLDYTAGLRTSVSMYRLRRRRRR